MDGDRRSRPVVQGNAPSLVERLVVNVFERDDHRVLAASPKEAAAGAVGEDFFRQPEMRHDREPYPNEIAWSCREGAEPVKALATGPLTQLIDDHRSDSPGARRPINSKRADLRDVKAKRRELGAADDGAAANGNHEPIRVHVELFKRTRKEMTFVDVRVDERVQFGRMRRLRRLKPDARLSRGLDWGTFSH